MVYNYEQSIWGRGFASLSPTSLASFRLRSALKALEQLPRGATVLELGSGAGQFIRSVAKLRPELSCFGCDISREAIALAQQEHDGVQYALSEEKVLPYQDEMFDAVLIFDVLEHVADVPAVLAEIRRVLKRGGILYAYVPCEGDRLSLWHQLRQRKLYGDLTRKHAGHINYFSRSSLRDAFLSSDLTPVTFRYSEHILGQMVGFAAFWLMERATKQRGIDQINNETYFTELEQSSRAPGLFNLFKKSVNSAVYLESVILNHIPSPNVHAVVKKM